MRETWPIREGLPAAAPRRGQFHGSRRRAFRRRPKVGSGKIALHLAVYVVRLGYVGVVAGLLEDHFEGGHVGRTLAVGAGVLELLLDCGQSRVAIRTLGAVGQVGDLGEGEGTDAQQACGENGA